MSRTTWLKVVALIVAFASLTINFGLIDLIDGFTGYVDQARNQVLDVGWGAMFGVIVPLGLLTQLRRPERRIAGIQQLAIVALALALAGVAGKAWWYLALALGIAVGLCSATCIASDAADILRRGTSPRADDARARSCCGCSLSRLRMEDDLGAARRPATSRCRVERPAPLDGHGCAGAGCAATRRALCHSLIRVADPRDQRVDRDRP